MAGASAPVILPAIEDALREGGLFRDPHSNYRRLREHQPVYWSPYLGQWLVTSYEYVEQVVRQPRLYSNFGFDTRYIARLPDTDRADAATLEHHFNQRGLIQADPPEHTRLRRALGAHFAAPAVQRLEEPIRAAITDLLDKAGSDGFDVMRDLAGPLPVRVIADLLGVPEADRAGFPVWSARAVRFFGTPAPDATNARSLDAALVEWRALLDRLLDERATEPRDDLLSKVAALVADGSITREEALFTCVHLLIAGHETTTNLIGNAVFLLLTHPDQLATLNQDPRLVPAAIEEVLRFEPPIQRIRRVAAEDTELGGMTIRKGDPVIPVLAAANRDPARFDDPDRFDVRRELTTSQQRHVAFGQGVHFCLGAVLARFEAPAALGMLLERYRGAALTPGFVPEWQQSINMRGLTALPLVFARAGLEKS